MSRSSVRRGALVIGTSLVAALALAACSSSGGSSGSADTTSASSPASTASSSAPESMSSSTSASAADYNLAAANCPSTIVLQTDWNPESEHGWSYELLGPDPKINANSKSVTGELVAHGGVDTGVKLEIRAGGPAIGFQTVTAQMYKDPSITIGYTGTDEQIANSKEHPTIGVFAALEKSPQIIQWSPDKHPDWKTIADIGKTNTKVLYFQGAAYMDYFTGKGILKKSQVDGSYDGTPTNFVASGGTDAVQGFATSEPYTWSKETKQWDKPLKYQLIADAGFNFYQSQIGIRAGDLTKLTPCLTKLVPIMQQAEVDFLASPDAVNKLILELVNKYNNGWVYTPGTATYAVSTMKSLGIIGNGSDSTLGNYDTARVQGLIDILKPIYAAQNVKLAADLSPSTLVTNQFIDPKIGLS